MIVLHNRLLFPYKWPVETPILNGGELGPSFYKLIVFLLRFYSFTLRIDVSIAKKTIV